MFKGRMMGSKKRLLLFFLATVLVAVGAPERPLYSLLAYFIGYPALIISIFSLEKRRSRAFCLYGAGVLYFLFHIIWLAAPKYHGPYIFFGYLTLSLIFPYCFYFLGYVLPKKANQLTFSMILSISLLYAILEYSRLWIFSGFPFHVSGLILSSNIYSLQLASIVGLYGLSFLVIMHALFTAKCFYAGNLYKPLIFALSPFFFGFLLYSTGDFFRKERGKINVAILQTALLVEEKWYFENHKDAFVSSAQQLKGIWEELEKLPPTDLVILPEVCLPGDGYLKRYTMEELQEIFPEEVWPFLLGANLSNMDIFLALSIYLNTDIMLGLIEGEWNSSFLISSGEIKGRYNKRRLVPFGEYIPFKFLKPMAKKYGIEASFLSGSEFSVLNGKWKILPTICFDEGFPDDYVKVYKYRPDIHINLSNDAWFINSSLPRAHFDLGRIRSVENGIYSIRSCNTGISAIISPKGEIVQKMEERNIEGQMNRGVIFDSLNLYKVNTIFSRLGNMWLLLVLVVLIAFSKAFSKRAISPNYN